MIKLKDLLSEKKEIISIDKAQDMRKAGYWMLVTNNLKKVIAVDKDKKKLEKLMKKYKGRLFGPLRTITISPEKQREYHKMHDLIWKHSKFGG
tara:strand:+ start:579 stop:857 length:279 start_codon:yes stop_codon:yes gene_type:complete